MIPPLTPLKSSVLEGMHHDPATSKLTLKFKNGKHWEYDDVGVDKVETLRGALSPGKFFTDRIRGVHRGREVSE